MAPYISINSAREAIISFASAAFFCIMIQGLSQGSNRAIVISLPAVKKVLENTTDRRYLVETFGFTNLTTLREIFAAADLGEAGFTVPDWECGVFLVLVPVALFGGFLNLYIAFWKRPRGRKSHSRLPKVLGGVVTWVFFSLLLDVSKVLLSASPNFWYSLAMVEGVETWIRSVPMALCLALIIYAAVSEDEELDGMGGREAIISNAGRSEEVVRLGEEKTHWKIKELGRVI